MTDVKQVDAVETRAPGRLRTDRPLPTPVPKQTQPAERGDAPPRVDRRDPRYLALRNFAISMSIFNILGYTVLGFEQPWTFPILALLVGYATEFAVEIIAARATRRRAAFTGNGAWGVYTFLLPTHITALAVNMLLYANDRFAAIAFGVVVAIGQKAILRAPVMGRMRHFMNPSNFGITIALLTFSWVNMAPPYEFTENVPDVFRVMVPTIIITAGTVLNTMLTKKVPLIMGWVGGFVIQALLRHYIWGVSLWGALVPMTGVAFVLYTNYMITDPGTTPSKGRWQFMFGSGVAMVYGVLMLFNVVYTLFFATCIVCLLRGGYWWVRWFVERRAAARVPRPVVPAPALEPVTA